MFLQFLLMLSGLLGVHDTSYYKGATARIVGFYSVLIFFLAERL